VFQYSDGWETRWVESDWKRSEGKAGRFKHTAGRYSADPDDKGLLLIHVISASTDDVDYLITKHLMLALRCSLKI